MRCLPYISAQKTVIKTFFLPFLSYNERLFELDTELKHVIFSVNELFACYAALGTVVALVVFFVNASWLVSALFDDLNSTVSTLSKRNHKELELNLRQTIIFHIKIKEYLVFC